MTIGEDRTDPRRPLEHFLLGETGRAQPSPEHVRIAGLAGYSYATLDTSPARDEFKRDFHSITARHMAVRSQVALLLRAWQAEGIEALVFKGFYLAEFVYPSFGQRPYNDIDLLVRPADVEAAWRVAEKVGWEVVWRAGQPDRMLATRAPDYHGHEAAQLRHPELNILVDLHRRIVHNNHNNLRSYRKQTELTDAVWQTSSRTIWEGAALRVPQPVDSVLFGLVLNRCWGSDEWQVKPRDYPDFQALIARFEFERAELVERAKMLSLQRTLAIYLNRCDPYRRLVNLAPPSWLELRRWNLRVTPERGQRDLERGVLAAAALPGEFLEIATALPTVLRVMHLRSRGMGAAQIFEQLATPAPEVSNSIGFREWLGISRGTHRCLRLLGLQGREREIVGRLAACLQLRRRGGRASLEFEDGAEQPVLMVDGQRVDGTRYQT